MAELKRKNGSIYYEVAGEGEPLVALRGLGRSIRHWLGYDEKLAENFKVITIDLRGAGRTTVPASYRDSIFDLAGDVVDVLNELGIPSAHMLGVSLGGMITLASGIKYSERFKSLIVVNTSIAGQRTLRMSMPGAKVLFEGLLNKRHILHEMLVDVLVGSNFPHEKRQEIVQQFKQIEKLEGLAGRTVLRQLVSAGRFLVKGKLRHMTVPTLVIYGTDDLFVPSINSKRLFRILPNAKLISIDGGGHELTIDKPEEVRQQLINWVAEITFGKLAG